MGLVVFNFHSETLCVVLCYFNIIIVSVAKII